MFALLPGIVLVLRPHIYVILITGAMVVNLATSLLIYSGSTPITIQRHYRAVLCLIGSMAIIFRSELALLALPTLIMVLYQGAAPLWFLIPFGASVAVGSIGEQ